MAQTVSLNREFSNLSDEERIRFIRSYKWIGYPIAKEVLSLLEELIEAPRTTRMANVLLIGRSGNGKTVLINRFAEKYTMYFDEELQETQQKVLLIEAPSSADERMFYTEILSELMIPYRSNHKKDILKHQVYNVLDKLNVKVLIIDEVQHFNLGKEKQRELLNALKTMSNKLQISIVATGIRDAYFVFNHDKQMRRRFETYGLSLWSLNKDYIKFLVSYEKILPLKYESKLYEKPIATKILSLSDNTIGSITEIVKKAAIAAIKKGTEEITLDLINSLNISHPEKLQQIPSDI